MVSAQKGHDFVLGCPNVTVSIFFYIGKRLVFRAVEIAEEDGQTGRLKFFAEKCKIYLT